VMYAYFASALHVSEARATALATRSEELATLNASRSRLVAQVLHTSETEQRQLAEALHDEDLQLLMVVRQELPADAPGRAREQLDQVIEHLRGEISELHPAVLDHVGLSAAVRQVAERQAKIAGFAAIVEVDEDACGIHDQLLFSISRELLTNAGKHAGATKVTCRITVEQGSIVLEVRDDGRGIDLAARDEAVKSGHIGLAANADRVEALGGRLEVDGHLDGARVRVFVPSGPQNTDA
jgi:two-component system, NarL family, sensor kinase